MSLEGTADAGIASMLFELVTLSCPLLVVEKVASRASDWIREAEAGTLLGCWRSEIGTLGRVLILRGFAHPEEMTAERRRALLSTDPFHGGAQLVDYAAEGFAAFPFLPPVRVGDRGGIYEVRTYWLKPGGLAPTLAGWEAAIEPARDYTRHLVTNLHALDGAPRITHIWAFDSLAQRADLRARAYGAGLWPPKGGPEQIITATSIIMLPLAGSPLR